MENKPRLNVLDILIILLIVFVLAVGVYFVANRGDKGASVNAGVIVEYDIKFTECEKAVADKFIAAKESEESVWVGEKERAEAVITEVVVETAKKAVADMDEKTVVLAEIEDLYDVTITLHSKGTETETQIIAGETPIQVGDSTAVKGKGFAGHGYITDLGIVK